MAEQFDPSEHTVDEVNAYLADADEAERERVLAAETGPDGKDRVGVKAPEADDNAPQTVTEAGETQPTVAGEKYEKGYDGFVPSRDGDDPEDLTLAGVLKRQNGEG